MPSNTAFLRSTTRTSASTSTRHPTSSALETAFKQAIYGKLALKSSVKVAGAPAGSHPEHLTNVRFSFSNVKEFKAGNKNRINADLTMTAKLPGGGQLVAKMTTHFGEKGGKFTIDQSPRLESVRVPASGLETGARFVARMNRIEMDQFSKGFEENFDKSHTVTFRKLTGNPGQVAIVEYASDTGGFGGPGFSWEEDYIVEGKKGKDGSYTLTKANSNIALLDPSGYPVDDVFVDP